MARMSREFNLVLLGAGLLTAGSFLLPEEDPFKRAEEEAASGNGGGGGRRGRSTVIFFMSYHTRPTRPMAATSGSAVRGGFGRVGGVFSGG